MHAMSLSFLSPVRIITDKRLARDPSFADIVRALLRRIHILATLYSQVNLEKGWAQPLIELAQTIRTVDSHWDYVCETRRSGSQQRDIPMDGVIGGMTVVGDLTRFKPFFDAGQWIGIGKTTSHGMGCYVVEADSAPYSFAAHK